MIFKRKPKPKVDDIIESTKFLWFPRVLENNQGIAWLELVECIGRYQHVRDSSGSTILILVNRYYKMNNDNYIIK